MKRLIAALIPAAWFCLMMSSHLYAETTAYIPNEGDDNIKRVYVSDETNFTEVDTCTGPYGAAVTPDGETLVISCSDDNAVRIVPTADFLDESAQTNVSLGTGHQPRGVAIESLGIYAYVANYGNNTVDKINISSGNVIQTYDGAAGIGDAPWGVAATYDSVEGTIKVYVSNYGDDSVSVISDSGVDTIGSVGDGPLGVALTPDGKYLYVALLNVDQVAVIDTSDNSVDTTINVGDAPWGVAMADDGAYVFVSNSNADTVSVIDTTSQSVAGTYAVGDQPMGVAAPVNGEFAYVVNQVDNSITKITTTGSRTTLGSSGFNSAIGLGAFIGDNPPEAPTSLEATASGSGIALSWTDNADDELGFKIERRQESEDAFTQIDKVDENVTTYTNRHLVEGTTYYYRVRAYKEASDSDYSASASAIPDDFSWCFINTIFRNRF